ncbi:MAG: hypothetical protein NVS3B20_02300 [Polyangiales bacterium]
MNRTAITLASGLAALAALGAIEAGCDRTPNAQAAESAIAPVIEAAAAPAADTGSYRVEVKAVGSYKKGAASTFEIVLKTKADYHVNEEYPAKFKPVDAKEAGVSYPKEKLERAKDGDAFVLEKCVSGKDNCTLRVKVAFTPTQSGTVKIGGLLNVGVCNAATCLIEKQALELSVPVT